VPSRRLKVLQQLSLRQTLNGSEALARASGVGAAAFARRFLASFRSRMPAARGRHRLRLRAAGFGRSKAGDIGFLSPATSNPLGPCRSVLHDPSWSPPRCPCGTPCWKLPVSRGAGAPARFRARLPASTSGYAWPTTRLAIGSALRKLHSEAGARTVWADQTDTRSPRPPHPADPVLT